MKQVLGAVSAVAMMIGSASAAVVYSENFDGQDGKGAIGASTDTAGVSWSIDTGSANLFNSSDFLAVTGGAFAFQDTNAGCSTSTCYDEAGDPLPEDLPMWLSPIINTSGLTNLQLSLDYLPSGTFEVGGGINQEDDFIVSVIADGIETILLDLVTANGSIAAGTLLSVLADASEIQIKVSANAYAGSERFAFDNVMLSGDAAAIPLPGAALLFATGLAGVVVRRRTV